MSRSAVNTRRCDLAWGSLPLLVPLLLLALRRTPEVLPPDRLLCLAVVPLVTFSATVLVFRAALWLGLFRSFARRGSAAVAAGLALAWAALRYPDWAPAVLQGLFLACFAVLLTLAALRPPRASEGRARSPGRGPWLDYVRLTKPALNGLVLAAVVLGYMLGSPGPIGLPRLLGTLVGAYGMAGGAAALNQFLERGRDRRMARTSARPLPSGRLAPRQAWVFGIAMALAGLMLLAGTVNLTTAFLATFSLAVYLFVYTPLKRVSPLATLVGAVSGAIPPLLGWFGAGGGLHPAALVLFFILYLWQIPHFLAIGWKYRAQYRVAGFRLYGAMDPTGRATGMQAVLYAAALLPVSLMTTWHGLTGGAYLLGAFVLGASLLGFSVAFARRPDSGLTRRLFIATIGYLPLIFLLMVLDKWLFL